MTDDEIRRAELARLGVARLGIPRLGFRLGYAPTDQEILARILVEHADFRTRLDLVEAKQSALRPARRRGQQKATAKRRKNRDRFVNAVDKELRKSDETTPRQAVMAVLKKTAVRGRPWNQLSPIERKRAVDAGVKRYRSAKPAE